MRPRTKRLVAVRIPDRIVLDEPDVSPLYESVQDRLTKGRSLREALEETILEQEWVRTKPVRAKIRNGRRMTGLAILTMAAGAGVVYLLRRKRKNVLVPEGDVTSGPGSWPSPVDPDEISPATQIIVSPDPGEEVSPARPITKARDREAIPSNVQSTGTLSDSIGTPVVSSDSSEQGDIRSV